MSNNYSIITGDCLEEMRKMPEGSVNCCVTSPPYFGLRDYGVDGQIGLEPTHDEYVAALVAVFREVMRVLRDDGTLWINIGSSYGSGKQLIPIPWLVALALQKDGWILRQDIIWAKPNPMPESVTDRCTKSHEYIFLLSKSRAYYYDNEAIKEPSISKESFVGRRRRASMTADSEASMGDFGATRSGFKNISEGKTYPTKNRRSVWMINTKPFKGAHFATFPEKLVEPCILAGCPAGGTVIDPFMGSGTTLAVAKRLGRNSIGIDLNSNYCDMARRRLACG